MSNENSKNKRKSFYAIISLNELLLVISKSRRSRSCLKIPTEDFYSSWYTDVSTIIKEIERRTAESFGEKVANVSCQPEQETLKNLQKIVQKNITDLVGSESECT